MAPKGAKKAESKISVDVKAEIVKAGDTVDAATVKAAVDNMSQKDRDKLA